MNIAIISDVVCPRCYIGKLAVSGAQGPEALLDAMRPAETAVV